MPEKPESYAAYVKRTFWFWTPAAVGGSVLISSVRDLPLAESAMNTAAVLVLWLAVLLPVWRAVTTRFARSATNPDKATGGNPPSRKRI